MYYAGTVLLGMSDETFWHCTPRKLKALLDVRNEVYSPTSPVQPKRGYIDEVLF
ncbi:MAG: hypothetical protein K6T83_10815 [Alicyclobacillus sp.]|nr:hypothetical protein [Alicyclobacillus sp.]